MQDCKKIDKPSKSGRHPPTSSCHNSGDIEIGKRVKLIFVDQAYTFRIQLQSQQDTNAYPRQDLKKGLKA